MIVDADGTVLAERSREEGGSWWVRSAWAAMCRNSLCPNGSGCIAAVSCPAAAVLPCEGAAGQDGEEDVRVINDVVVAYTGLTDADMGDVERRERDELVRRARLLRRTRPRVSLSGRTVVVVDDGIATGATARAACQVARANGARRVVLAVPVAPRDTLALLKDEADELVCLEVPTWFSAVGCWYRRFGQVSDDEVTEPLRRAAGDALEPQADAADDPPLRDDEVRIQAGEVELAGHLTIPDNAIGMVVFAHGSGSSRHSPRNRYVAGVLNRAGLATLLFDLLTVDEGWSTSWHPPSRADGRKARAKDPGPSGPNALPRATGPDGGWCDGTDGGAHRQTG
ncbi:Phosphoribosyl transferase domain-containing protein [Nocardia amikacinitolerans]|nr:Phosphoribosyl transferase domain-containing protein [Nocardia amikacinitolerans]